jgi:hypothetical protein
MNFLSRSMLGGFALIAGMGLVPSAQADTITYQITSDHCTGGCLTGQSSGGTVSITDISSGVVQVTATLANGNKFVNTGIDAAIGFDLSSGPTITYSSLTTGFTPFAGNNPTGPQSVHQDGVGNFQYGVVCTGCGNGGSSPLAGPLVFDVSGTGVSTASFISNGTAVFALDIISGTTGKTGAVDASVTAVPVPLAGAGLPGLVAACGALLAFARRRRAAQQSA